MQRLTDRPEKSRSRRAIRDYNGHRAAVTYPELQK